ncbi:MAG: pilus assembly protein N-terminal domain-containing protein [Alphaproteobacteria bacterium]|nr:pilus assembly protein N-terminal domain-containing protein [Alphaproteobacteria bacterium]
MLLSRLSQALKLLLFGVGVGLATPAFAQDMPTTQWLDVEVGQSSIQKSARPFHRVLISDPAVADIKLLEEGQFQVLGKSIGTTDLWVWYRDDPQRPEVIELTVHRDISDLIRRVGELVTDGPPPKVYPLEGRLVVDGPVPDLQTLERISAVATIFDPEFVNLMSVKGDHQVQLQVTFAEVNRTATREMGFNALWGNEDVAAGIYSSATTGDRGGIIHPTGANDNNLLAPELINSGITLTAGSGAFGLLGVISQIDLAAIMSVLEEHKITKVLAEPTLVVLSGQQAEFLAGGEIPVPVAQTNNRITLEFKEYGIILVFVPTVLADGVIDLRVTVEYSEIDNTTGTSISGIEIPGYLVRKSESHLRINDGMTFAMAGLMSDQLRYSRAQIPLLGDIPVVGALFSYTSHVREETELMIFVTPRLVRPLSPEEVPAPPGTTEDNNPNDFELFWLGMDHRARSRSADSSDPSGPVGASR